MWQMIIQWSSNEIMRCRTAELHCCSSTALHDHAHCMHCTLAYLTSLTYLTSTHLEADWQKLASTALLTFAHRRRWFAHGWHHHCPTTKWHVGIGACGTIKTLCRLPLVDVLTWRKCTGCLLLGHSYFSCSRYAAQITNHAKVNETLRNHTTHYTTLRHINNTLTIH